MDIRSCYGFPDPCFRNPQRFRFLCKILDPSLERTCFINMIFSDVSFFILLSCDYEIIVCLYIGVAEAEELQLAGAIAGYTIKKQAAVVAKQLSCVSNKTKLHFNICCN